MIIKLIRIKFNKPLNLSSIYQLRKCQTKCAIDRLDSNQNECNFNNIYNQDKSSSQDLNGNQEANQKSDKLSDKSKEDKLNKKLEEENLKKELKENLRIQRYKKDIGLEDLDDEKALAKISEYFVEHKPGLRYFERTGSPVYGTNYNTPIWTRSKLDKQPQYKFIAAEQFEKNIIYDFSYENFMNRKEKNSLVYQILISLGLNSKNRNPFPLLFANLDKNTYTYEQLDRYYFSVDKIRPKIKVTDKSYLDLLPKEEIIYLSPHAEESLDEFNPNYHYVIGCFVDISFSKNLSFKKAQVEGVKSYKLPIDEFVAYSKIKNKLLPLPIVQQILLDKKMNVDWKFTLECNLGRKRLDLELDEVHEFTNRYKNFKKHMY